MSTSPHNGDDHPVPPKSSTVILLLTIGDTTWRMFVPIIGLMVVGLLVDRWLSTTPWIMTIGLALGIFLSALLIKQQVKKVKQT